MYLRLPCTDFTFHTACNSSQVRSVPPGHKQPGRIRALGSKGMHSSQNQGELLGVRNREMSESCTQVQSGVSNLNDENSPSSSECNPPEIGDFSDCSFYLLTKWNCSYIVYKVFAKIEIGSISFENLLICISPSGSGDISSPSSLKLGSKMIRSQAILTKDIS